MSPDLVTHDHRRVNRRFIIFPLLFLIIAVGVVDKRIKLLFAGIAQRRQKHYGYDKGAARNTSAGNKPVNLLLTSVFNPGYIRMLPDHESHNG
ncbi:hypothetical protein NB694_004570 [Pantoea ananatis]|nr:hypothetical protein [Pantoea ananatis]